MIAVAWYNFSMNTRKRAELERLNEKLDAANKELADLYRLKSKLLSFASHQVRSPLAAIKGSVSLIMNGSYGAVNDKTKEALSRVQKQTDGLIILIDTLLDVRKMEGGRMEYRFVKTDLSKIVSEVVSTLQPLAETKKLEFGFTSPEKEVWVNADAEKLKQAIQNLADNAIKYTPGGFVHAELKTAGGSAIVSISDSGVGIPVTLITHLFEEFVRDERVKKEIRGTGLGLYIARKITEAHGGTIFAESAGEGKGAQLYVKIPGLK